MDEGRVRPEHAQLGKVLEARLPQCSLHRRGQVEVEAEVAVEDDVLAVGERLGRAQQLVGRGALAVERDVAVDDAVGVAVAATAGPPSSFSAPLAVGGTRANRLGL